MCLWAHSPTPSIVRNLLGRTLSWRGSGRRALSRKPPLLSSANADAGEDASRRLLKEVIVCSGTKDMLDA